MSDTDTNFLSTEQFLHNWLGHRRLTRRIIEAFPEDQLFSFQIGGMRTAADIAHELLQVGVPVVRQAGGQAMPDYESENPYSSKAELLEAWDEDTEALQAAFNALTAEQFDAGLLLFGSFQASGRGHLVYALDNELHHRGQLYVYLRALNVEPPAFYERDMVA